MANEAVGNLFIQHEAPEQKRKLMEALRVGATIGLPGSKISSAKEWVETTLDPEKHTEDEWSALLNETSPIYKDSITITEEGTEDFSLTFSSPWTCPELYVHAIIKELSLSGTAFFDNGEISEYSYEKGTCTVDFKGSIFCSKIHDVGMKFALEEEYDYDAIEAMEITEIFEEIEEEVKRAFNRELTKKERKQIYKHWETTIEAE